MKIKRKQSILPSPDAPNSDQKSKQRFFKQLLLTHTIEARLPQKFYHSLMITFYLIHAYNLLPQTDLKKWLDSFVMQMFVEEFNIFAWVWTSQIFLTHLLIFLNCTDATKVHSLLDFNVASTNVYLYIGFPVATMFHGVAFAQNYIEDKRSVGESFWILAGFLFIPLSHLLVFLAFKLKSSIPSSSAASIPSVTAVAACKMMLSISLLLLSFINTDTSIKSSVRFALLGLISGIYLGSIYVQVFTLTSWNQDTNLLETQCLSILASLFAAIHLSTCSSAANQAILFLIIQSFLRRAAANLMRQSLRVDIFADNVGDFEFKKGLVLMMSLLQSGESWSCPKSSSTLELASYYLGIWEKTFSRSAHVSFSVDRIVSFVVDKRESSRGRILILLIVQSTRALKYFRNTRVCLQELKSMSNSSFFEQFEAFQYEALWQSRFELIYDSKITPSLDGPDEPLLQVSESMRLLFQYKETVAREPRVDCLKTFNSIDMFEKLSSLIDDMNKNQLDLFEDLAQDKNISLTEIMKRNKDINLTRQKIKKSTESIVKGQIRQELVSYIYPSLIYFYALVQYDIETADSLLIRYKKKLSLLFSSSLYRKSELNSVGLEIDAVTMKVILEKDQLGVISDISLNANHYMGKQSSLTLVNRSVNSLLPENMWEEHNRIMLSDRTLTVINRSRSVFIINFEGNLKQCLLSTRLAPSVTHTISAFSSLTFNSLDKGPSILLDTTLDIVAADTTFNQLLCTSGISRQSSNKLKHSLSKVSRKLFAAASIILRIHRCLQQRRAETARLKQQGGTDHMRDKLFELFGVILEVNQSAGMLFKTERNSLLQDLLLSESVHARFEFIEILGIQMIKLFISRKRQAEAQDQNRDRQMMCSPKRVTSTEYLLRRQLTDEEEDSNIPARLSDHLLPDYNSECKESVVGKARKKSNQFFEVETTHIASFEETIFPLLDMVESAANKMPQTEQSKRDQELEEILALIRQFKLIDSVISANHRNNYTYEVFASTPGKTAITKISREASYFDKSHVTKLKPNPQDQITADLQKKSTASLDRSIESRRYQEAVQVSTFHTITKLLSVLSVAACDSVQR